jgi:phosphoesterase RecJ-like protein
VTNLGYGTVNLVDAAASSTAEVVLSLLQHMDTTLDAQAATCLLTGIVTDTRGFRTSTVTLRTMEAATRLMRAGASLTTITREALDRRSIAALRLWGAALSRIGVQRRVIWTAIPLAVSQQTGFAGGGDAGLASYLMGAEGADGAVVFVEQEENRVDVGMRASPGFDVSQIALRLGGGGHALAAGCSLQGALEDVVNRVLPDLQGELARQRDSGAGRDSQPQQASRPDVA